LKQLSIFMGIFIIFYTTACSNTATPIKTTFAKFNGGGNPEVNLNLCIRLENKAKTQCLDNIFPNNPNITN